MEGNSSRGHSWMANSIGIFCFDRRWNCGTEVHRLQRAKRVLDKSNLFIDKLQAEIKSLRQLVDRLTKNCQKKCPLVRSVLTR